MKRLLVLVEGQTEEAFFNGLLASHLALRGIDASCTSLCTSRRGGRREFRGGHAGRFDLIERDVWHLLRNGNPDHVTTLLDLYGLPEDFPGLDTWSGGAPRQKAHHLEKAFADRIGDHRFIPNVVVHEFEALLFSDSTKLLNELLAIPGVDDNVAETIEKVMAVAPEDINDSPEMAPSKRLRAMCPGYDKRLHGPLIAESIGLQSIRSKCLHFNEWLTRLEALGAREVTHAS